MSDLMELIKGRRSIRRFLDEPVSEEQLAALLEAVRWSPSWVNKQCWEIVVVRDPETKQALQAAVGRNPAFDAMMQAPLVLVICGRQGRAGFKKGEALTRFGDWHLFDLGICTQNICLTAHFLGLGTVIVGLFDHARVDEEIGTPEGVQSVVMIPVGVPAAAGPAPPRREATEFCHLEGF